ncbi:unnamed protein product [Nesidiocoris tenuis]|uniref:Uncharacterized protein n=1 Tax=Nesidiocoris tenuis TaxID=355587 RepID=A0A6H5G1P5_9HEMI|nr:unnamed protein product [Nesidiocoris tenuis]
MNIKRIAVSAGEYVFFNLEDSGRQSRYLRWDREAGASPYRSSGFWTSSLGCIHMQKDRS